MFADKNLLINVQRAAAHSPTELASVLGITVEQLEQSVTVMPRPSKTDLVKKLTGALHLNQKLYDTAIGPDATIHQYIENEITDVISLIK